MGRIERHALYQLCSLRICRQPEIGGNRVVLTRPTPLLHSIQSDALLVQVLATLTNQRQSDRARE